MVRKCHCDWFRILEQKYLDTVEHFKRGFDITPNIELRLIKLETIFVQIFRLVTDEFLLINQEFYLDGDC